MKLALSMTLTWLMLPGCAPTPSTPAPRTASSAPAESEHAPFPFTAEQIRDATKPGRIYELRLEAKGQPPVTSRITFVAVTPENAQTESMSIDELGAPIGPVARTEVTWSELMQHATFPKAATVVTGEEVEVPAGRFSCLVYTVTEAGTRTRLYFAKNLPGAPVRMLVEKDGQLVQSMTLVRHLPGS